MGTPYATAHANPLRGAQSARSSSGVANMVEDKNKSVYVPARKRKPRVRTLAFYQVRGDIALT